MDPMPEKDQTLPRETGEDAEMPQEAGVPSFAEEDTGDLDAEMADRVVFTRVVRHFVMKQPGVAALPGSWWRRLRRTSGVDIGLGRQGALHVTVTIIARYGFDLRTLGQRVQETAAASIRRLSGRPVKRVNVRIAGIRGTQR